MTPETRKRNNTGAVREALVPRKEITMNREQEIDYSPGLGRFKRIKDMRKDGWIPQPTRVRGAVSVSVTVDDAINNISEITKHQGGPLVKDIHGCILRLLKGEKGATAGFESWPHLLDAAHFESQRRDIFIFLEYLGASDWYERKIDLATKIVRTKEGKPVTRRGAAIHVLKEVLKNVDPGTETTAARKNRLNTHLTRGRRLRSLVDKFGRGILFNTKLWTWIKSKEEFFDSLLEAEADKESDKVLMVLSLQLESMVQTGSPDLGGLLKSLRDENLLSDGRYRELKTQHGLDVNQLNGRSPALEKPIVLEGTQFQAHAATSTVLITQQPDEEKPAPHSSLVLSPSVPESSQVSEWV
ncbi:hypothetical protein BDW69DRAFT_186970 [Aspergillus filifer]